MKPLTFSVVLDQENTGAVRLEPCEDNLRLEACSPCDITEPMWKELAANIADEPRLIPYPASVLARRCHEGYAALAACNGHIVSYISLVPVLQRGQGHQAWSEIARVLGVDRASLPCTGIYEFTSSWTHPTWRRRRVSLALRPPLLERFLPDGGFSNALGISGMVGLASPILARLGWQVLGWGAAPFVTSLIGVPFRNFPDQAAMGWRPPEGHEPYDGPPVPLGDPTHAWEQYCYCWVSSLSLAADLDAALAMLLDGDLHRWRSAMVGAFAVPMSSHRLAFLP